MKIPFLTPKKEFKKSIYHLSDNVYLYSPIITEGKIPLIISDLFKCGTEYNYNYLFSFGRSGLCDLYEETNVVNYYSYYLLEDLVYSPLPAIQFILRYPEIKDRVLDHLINSHNVIFTNI